eukprot:m.183160 g.183160  ORF g.183160 m.183160 type:complete len:792 (-) comp17469_c2_seq1:1185-3560(-)
MESPAAAAAAAAAVAGSDEANKAVRKKDAALLLSADAAAAVAADLSNGSSDFEEDGNTSNTSNTSPKTAAAAQQQQQQKPPRQRQMRRLERKQQLKQQQQQQVVVVEQQPTPQTQQQQQKKQQKSRSARQQEEDEFYTLGDDNDDDNEDDTNNSNKNRSATGAASADVTSSRVYSGKFRDNALIGSPRLQSSSHVDVGGDVDSDANDENVNDANDANDDSMFGLPRQRSYSDPLLKLQRRKQRTLSHSQTSSLAGSPVSGLLEDCHLLSHIAPEPQEGCVEYKLKLVDPPKSRVDHLVTQMAWRLNEGDGEATYIIGVADDGEVVGLSQSELDQSLDTLKEMARRVHAEIMLCDTQYLAGNRCVAEVHLRKLSEGVGCVDVRVSLVGGDNAGKSSLLGVLTTGETDNGHGKARLNLFRHHHEIKSGLTSSISQDIVGFDERGARLHFNACSKEEFRARARKVVTFLDSPGHEKYMRTAVFGVSSQGIDCVAVTVSASSPDFATVKEFVRMTRAFMLPTVFIVTKIDICTKQMLTDVLRQISAIVSTELSKSPQIITRDEELATLPDLSLRAPIFMVSSVTGKNLPLLYRFLFLLSPQPDPAKTRLPALFQVEGTFRVTGAGVVVAGFMVQGAVSVDDKLMLGPARDGSFIPVTIQSVHRNRTATRGAQAGQLASFALLGVERSQVRRGQVLSASAVSACVSIDVDIALDAGEVYALSSSPASLPHQLRDVQVFAGVVRRRADMTLVTEDPLCVRFTFPQPEFIMEGAVVFFWAGVLKGHGRVKSVQAWVNE